MMVMLLVLDTYTHLCAEFPNVLIQSQSRSWQILVLLETRLYLSVW